VKPFKPEKLIKVVDKLLSNDKTAAEQHQNVNIDTATAAKIIEDHENVNFERRTNA
jgi:two-component SAPR family response regulator